MKRNASLILEIGLSAMDTTMSTDMLGMPSKSSLSTSKTQLDKKGVKRRAKNKQAKKSRKANRK